MAKENLKNLVGVIIFYAILTFGIIELSSMPEDVDLKDNSNVTIEYQK